MRIVLSVPHAMVWVLGDIEPNLVSQKEAPEAVGPGRVSESQGVIRDDWDELSFCGVF